MKIFVHTLPRPLLGAAAALALGLTALAPAAVQADEAPIQTTPATDVTDTSATLTGIIGTQGKAVAYRFQYGVIRYDHATPVSTVPARDAPRPVSATVTGLTPGTLYHFRLVATFGNPGDDQTFTTAPAPAPVAGAVPAPVAAAPLPVPGAAPPAAAPPPVPTLGEAVVVAPVSGIVKVKPPGAGGYTTLAAGGSVPTGSTVDTRGGEVAVTSALPGGTTQTAQFHGGVFRVRQSATGGGTTDIDLRGPALRCAAPRARASAAAVRKRKPARRKLWARDAGGRYRTHGANSVATVRGTSWVTTDTCAGTRTTVTQGAVAVRDVHRKRTVVVRAGHSYLARRR